MHVEFQEAQTQLERRREGGNGVFRKVAGVAAVGNQVDQACVFKRASMRQRRMIIGAGWLVRLRAGRAGASA